VKHPMGHTLAIAS